MIDKFQLKVVKSTNKDGKEYYALVCVLNEKIEKILCFLTKDQYTILSASNK